MGNCICKKPKVHNDGGDDDAETQSGDPGLCGQGVVGQLIEAVQDNVSHVANTITGAVGTLEQKINPVANIERAVCKRAANVVGRSIMAIPVACGAVLLVKAVAINASGSRPNSVFVVVVERVFPTAVLGVGIGIYCTLRYFSRSSS